MSLAADVLAAYRARGWSLATAESCTGGLIAAALTSVAGSSDVIRGGVVAYSNSIKEALLDVDYDTLVTDGAVSESTALQMAFGVRKAMHADVAIAVTGIAGPDGGTPEKPVGLVWIATAGPDGARATKHHFEGDRDGVRQRTVNAALQLLLEEARS